MRRFDLRDHAGQFFRQFFLHKNLELRINVSVQINARHRQHDKENQSPPFEGSPDWFQLTFDVTNPLYIKRKGKETDSLQLFRQRDSIPEIANFGQGEIFIDENLIYGSSVTARWLSFEK